MSDVSRRGMLGLIAAAPLWGAKPLAAGGAERWLSPSLVGEAVTDAVLTPNQARQLLSIDIEIDPASTDRIKRTIEAHHRVLDQIANHSLPREMPSLLSADDAGAGASSLRGAPVPDLHCNGYLDCTLKKTCASCHGIREPFAKRESVLNEARAC